MVDLAKIHNSMKFPKIEESMSLAALRELDKYLRTKQYDRARALIDEECGYHHVDDDEITEYIDYMKGILGGSDVTVKQVKRFEVKTFTNSNSDNATQYLVRTGNLLFVSKCLRSSKKEGQFYYDGEFYNLDQVDQVFEIVK